MSSDAAASMNVQWATWTTTPGEIRCALCGQVRSGGSAHSCGQPADRTAKAAKASPLQAQASPLAQVVLKRRHSKTFVTMQPPPEVESPPDSPEAGYTDAVKPAAFCIRPQHHYSKEPPTARTPLRLTALPRWAGPGDDVAEWLRGGLARAGAAVLEARRRREAAAP